MSGMHAESDPFGLVGTILDGQYRVERVVGEGGFGVVYRGYHLSFEQPVAIKALKLPELDPATQKALLAKFREEAKLLYVLSQASLNIVRSIGFGAVNTPRGIWAPFVVLEWLEGKSLAEELAERRAAGLGGRSLTETMALLEPAAQGLIAAHHKHVAHRDVKPGNVFLTMTRDDPPHPTAKVLDFGIAKVILADGATARPTAFTSFTPYYAAPEQLDPRLGPTGLHTDVYSFALVFVEVLTGRPPVEGNEIVQILLEATNPARRPTPRARGAAVPEVVEEVFARALAIEPRARHADMQQMWEALTKAVAAGAPTGTVAIPSVPGARVHVHVPTQPMPASAAPRAPSPSMVTPPPMAVPAAPPAPSAARWTPAYPPVPNTWNARSAPYTPSEQGVHWSVWAVVGLVALVILGGFVLLFALKACR